MKLRASSITCIACVGVPLALLTGAMHASGQQRPAELEGAAPRAAPAEDRKERRSRPRNLVGHGGPIKAVAIDSRTGRVLTGSFDYAMMVWDASADTVRRLARLDDHKGAINTVAFVPGTSLALAAGDDGAVAVWDVERGRLVRSLDGHQAKIVAVAVSTDGRWAASASWDHTIRIWDLGKLEAAGVLRGHTAPVNAIAFSADATRLYSASADGTIGLWNRADGSFARPLRKLGWGLNVLARLPGTEQLVFGSVNGSAAIVDGETGELVRELPPHDRPVLALDVLERPGLVATGSADGVIHVLRSADGTLIEQYRNPYGPIWALAFLADGTALYYGGLDDFATFWRVAPRDSFEPIDSAYPRRFQVRAQPSDLIAAGEVQFARKCSVCHTLQADGRNRAGPTLYRVFGRRIGTMQGYPYSEALKKLDIVWTADTIGKLFELGPEVFTPGSKMPLQKMEDPAQRQALIAYLQLATAGQDDARAVDGKGPVSPELPHTGEKK